MNACQGMGMIPTIEVEVKDTIITLVTSIELKQHATTALKTTIIIQTASEARAEEENTGQSLMQIQTDHGAAEGMLPTIGWEV